MKARTVSAISTFTLALASLAGPAGASASFGAATPAPLRTSADRSWVNTSIAPERRAELAQTQNPEEPYESEVSEDLLTEIGERHIVAGSGVMLLALLGIHRAAGRRMRQ